jgi:hypothetical protein
MDEPEPRGFFKFSVDGGTDWKVCVLAVEIGSPSTC